MNTSHNGVENSADQRASLRAGGPHSFENDASHHVAMHVTGLTSAVAALILLTRSPASLDLLAFDRETMIDAHKQLGRLIERVPTIQRVAAE